MTDHDLDLAAELLTLRENPTETLIEIVRELVRRELARRATPNEGGGT